MVEVEGAGKIETSSAWLVPRSLRSFSGAEMSEFKEVHHSPEGNFCINANLRRFAGRVEVSFSTRGCKLSMSRDIGAFACEA